MDKTLIVRVYEKLVQFAYKNLSLRQ